MSKTWLGKIEEAVFGFGGYQDAQFGASFTLEGSGFGIGDFWGFWATERSSSTKWTEEDRIKHYGETTRKIQMLMEDAKVQSFRELVGIPVEVKITDDQRLDSWRILTEVL